MAKLNARLLLETNGESLEFMNSSDYTQKYDFQQDIGFNDAFISMATFDPTNPFGTNKLADPRLICIHNPSDQVIEVRITYKGITAGSTDATGATDGEVSKLLRPNEYIVYPNAMAVNYTTTASAMNGTDLDLDDDITKTLSTTLYTYSNATLGADLEDTETTVTVSDADYFKVGDLIQVGINDTTATRIEIMRITKIASTTLTVERALNGTQKADKDAQTNATNGAVNGARIYFPHFNALDDYNTYTTPCTDLSGNLVVTNLFGYGRNATASLDGFCRGTIVLKFYKAGYQEFGISNITSRSKTGLTAGTTYYVKIGIDGATADEISITTDSSVDTFGGTNGFIQKLQEAIDALYYDASKNNFQKGATVSIVNGDIRVTSKQHLSTSAIALTAGTSGADTTTEIFAQAIGRIPASPEGARAARLPDSDIIKDGIERDNEAEFMYDDGYGNLNFGANSTLTGSGTIDYDTGALTLRNCPSFANYAITATGLSGLACGGNTNTTMLTEIQARSVNPKRRATVRIVAFDL